MKIEFLGIRIKLWMSNTVKFPYNGLKGNFQKSFIEKVRCLETGFQGQYMDGRTTGIWSKSVIGRFVI